MAKRKVIISCAITGAIHTPSMSPHLPVTAEEILVVSVVTVPTSMEIARLLNHVTMTWMSKHPNQVEIDNFYRQHPTIDTWNICNENGLQPVYRDEVEVNG